YCFNLSCESKFDFEQLKNKIPLRNLLKRKISWDQQKRGVDLYFDLDVAIFKERIMPDLVPQALIGRIEESLILPSYVKKRTLLELFNFYGYCRSHGYEDSEIEKILMG